MDDPSVMLADRNGEPLVLAYRPTASLVPDPRNARTHPKQQVAQLVQSIQAFGFTNPILVDEDGHIIAGHGRLLAAKQIGLIEVPTIALPHLSEAQKRALRLADNKIALGAGWDLDILKLELADLAVLDVDFDLSLTGFSSGEIDIVLNGQSDPDDELIPAAPTTPRTRSGDIWILGEHRVGCGDGRDPAFYARWSGRGRRSTPRSSTRPTTSRSTAMPTPRGVTASLRWHRAR